MYANVSTKLAYGVFWSGRDLTVSMALRASRSAWLRSEPEIVSVHARSLSAQAWAGVPSLVLAIFCNESARSRLKASPLWYCSFGYNSANLSICAPLHPKASHQGVPVRTALFSHTSRNEA